MGKSRLVYFDNIKGLMILLVVIGHFIEPLSAGPSRIYSIQVLYDFIYVFHMPVFVFVTGVFSKNTYVDGKYRAEVPIFYLLVSAGLYTCLMLESWISGRNLGELNYLTSGGDVAWYLLAAAVYSLCIPFFANLKAVYAIGAAVVLSVLVGLVEGTSILALSRVITFAPFFLLGYYIEPGKLVACRSLYVGKRFLLASTFVLFTVFVLFFAQGDEVLLFLRQFLFGNRSYASVMEISGLALPVWMCTICRAAYYIAVPIIGVCVALLVPVGTVGFLTRGGVHSLQVYVLHPLIYYLPVYVSFSRKLGTLLPGFAVALILIALAMLVAFLLALPEAPQRFFANMKSFIRQRLSCLRYPEKQQ